MDQIVEETQTLELRIEELTPFKEVSKDYQITGPNRPNGHARIYFYILYELREFPCVDPIAEVHHVLSQRGLSPEDVVTGIAMFYPNGGGKPCRQYMRHGAGSMLLERIMKDSRERGARALFLSTGNKSMKSFVEKKRFVLFGSFGVGDGYYLML